MQTELVRPNFSCTVCRQSFDSLYTFKEHLESHEHELAYGLRLKNSLVGSYFCNCCHVCVNTLLIWKSHIMGIKHMKIAAAFTAAYPTFEFDKPARVADVGILDQNVELPESLQRATGKPSHIIRTLDKGSVIIGVTEIEYDGPGLYTCRICDEPFNEGNKSQHLLSCRHRVNVFKRWDTALAEEALMVKEVGKPEFSARCETIASEIFPVEQGILNKSQKQIYERIMGTNADIDEMYKQEQEPPPPAPAPRHPPYAPVRPPPPPASRGYADYHDPYARERPYPPPRDEYVGRPPPRYPPPAPPHARDPYARERYDEQYGRPRPPPRPPHDPYPPIPRNPRRGYDYGDPGRGGPSRLPRKEVIIDSPLKCDLAMETIRTCLKNLNVFVAEAQGPAVDSITRVDVLKSQILFDEILKLSYPKQPVSVADDDYITVFHNGRLTLKRREPVVPTTSTLATLDIKDTKTEAPDEKTKDEKTKDEKSKDEKTKEDSKDSDRKFYRERESSRDRRSSHSKDEKRERSSSHSKEENKDGKDPKVEIKPPLFPIPPGFPNMPPGYPTMPGGGPPGMVPPNRPMLDPWGRPMMMPPGMPNMPNMPMSGDMPRMPFFPPPGFRPEGDRSDRDRSPRKRTPPPGGRDSKRNRSNSPKKSPERVITIKLDGGLHSNTRVRQSPDRNRSPRSRRKSPSRRSPSRRSPLRKQDSSRTSRTSPGRRRSPSRRSPSGRRSPSKRSPARRSPGRRSPRRRSPARRSPGRRSPHRERRPRSPAERARKPSPRKRRSSKDDKEDGTVFLEDDAYAELLASLG